MTRDDRDPNDESLECAIAALRERTPADRNAAASHARLMHAFDHQYRRAWSWPRLLVAAALLLTASLALRRPAERLVESQRELAAVSARLSELEARIASWRRAKDAERVLLKLSLPNLDPTVREAVESVGEIVGPDPGFLRLLTAQRREATDPAGAIERYRDLITDYAESPAASVARRRLSELAK